MLGVFTRLIGIFARLQNHRAHLFHGRGWSRLRPLNGEPALLGVTFLADACDLCCQQIDVELPEAITRVEMDSRAFALTVQRTKDAAKAGQQPGAESSMFKIYGTELNQRRNELLVRILGPDALGWEGPGFDDFALSTTRDWLRSRGNSIEGGTSEIQLNIIAKRVLGLPT